MTILSRVYEIWRKGLSMVVKTLILTGVAGLSSWWVMDHLLNERIGVLFSRHFLELMEQQASKDRQLLHEFLSFHSWAVTLFVRQENFFHHLENYHNAGWSLEDSPKVIYHNQKPSWLPGRSVTRKMAYATHVALLDGEFRLREVYAQVPPPMSEENLNELLVHNSKEHGQNTLTEVNGVLNLVTTAALQDQNGETMGWLVFISPMNDELLFLFQQQYRSMGIAAFINNKDDRVVASSRPELVAKGSAVSQLQRNYHISGKKFLDHGFSADATVRFVTLIPLSQLDDLSDSVLAEERTYRGIAHVVLTMVFLAI
ncbi:MAG: hypothetical protein HQL55_15840, partial [Magnetococcales bacterium]|nr:hypothetical protein [Magnetococcales bacterium]